MTINPVQPVHHFDPPKASKFLDVKTIAFVFVAIAGLWLLRFAESKPVEDQRLQAVLVVRSAAEALQASDLAKADRLLSKAYTIYTTSLYSPRQLSAICSKRAQVNALWGKKVLAEQFSLQAAEFRKAG